MFYIARAASNLLWKIRGSATGCQLRMIDAGDDFEPLDFSLLFFDRVDQQSGESFVLDTLSFSIAVGDEPGIDSPHFLGDKTDVRDTVGFPVVGHGA